MAVTLSQARAIYDRYRPWILRYRGGFPAGLVATVIAHESGGRIDAQGDPELGEYGLMQVTPWTCQTFSVPETARLDPETNVMLGCLRLQIDAVKMFLFDPSRIVLGSADALKLARLGSAIGVYGTQQLIRAAGPAPRGAVFEHVRSWCNRTGGIGVSSKQDAAKTTSRVNGVEEHWRIGQAVGGLEAGAFGAPERLPPAPRAATYVIPASLAPHLAAAGSASSRRWALYAAGGLLLLGGVVWAATLD